MGFGIRGVLPHCFTRPLRPSAEQESIVQTRPSPSPPASRPPIRPAITTPEEFVNALVEALERQLVLDNLDEEIERQEEDAQNGQENSDIIALQLQLLESYRASAIEQEIRRMQEKVVEGRAQVEAALMHLENLRDKRKIVQQVLDRTLQRLVESLRLLAKQAFESFKIGPLEIDFEVIDRFNWLKGSREILTNCEAEWRRTRTGYLEASALVLTARNRVSKARAHTSANVRKELEKAAELELSRCKQSNQKWKLALERVQIRKMLLTKNKLRFQAYFLKTVVRDLLVKQGLFHVPKSPSELSVGADLISMSPQQDGTDKYDSEDPPAPPALVKKVQDARNRLLFLRRRTHTHFEHLYGRVWAKTLLWLENTSLEEAERLILQVQYPQYTDTSHRRLVQGRMQGHLRDQSRVYQEAREEASAAGFANLPFSLISLADRSDDGSTSSYGKKWASARKAQDKQDYARIQRWTRNTARGITQEQLSASFSNDAFSLASTFGAEPDGPPSNHKWIKRYNEFRNKVRPHVAREKSAYNRKVWLERMRRTRRLCGRSVPLMPDDVDIQDPWA